MESSKFNDILASIATMTDQQKLQLFTWVVNDSKDILWVGLSETREGVNESLAENPLTDTEWEAFKDNADGQVQNDWSDIYWDSITHARPSANPAEDTTDDEED